MLACHEPCLSCLSLPHSPQYNIRYHRRRGCIIKRRGYMPTFEELRYGHLSMKSRFGYHRRLQVGKYALNNASPFYSTTTIEDYNTTMSDDGLSIPNTVTMTRGVKRRAVRKTLSHILSSASRASSRRASSLAIEVDSRTSVYLHLPLVKD